VHCILAVIPVQITLHKPDNAFRDVEQHIHSSTRRVVLSVPMITPLASVLLSYFAEAGPSGTQKSGDGAFC